MKRYAFLVQGAQQSANRALYHPQLVEREHKQPKTTHKITRGVGWASRQASEQNAGVHSTPVATNESCIRVSGIPSLPILFRQGQTKKQQTKHLKYILLPLHNGSSILALIFYLPTQRPSIQCLRNVLLHRPPDHPLGRGHLL